MDKNFDIEHFPTKESAKRMMSRVSPIYENSYVGKVKRPASIFAYIFGSIGAIVMGSGMSLVMTDIGATLGIADAMVPGIGIGIVGMLMAIINYPVYKSILGSRRRKYADKIIALSDKIMKA